MKVFRIEDKNGEGCFTNKSLRNNSIFKKAIDRHTKDFPTPREEDGIDFQFRSGHHYCAYKSEEQLHKWLLPAEIKEMLKAGFKIYCITLSNYLEGEEQVVFLKSDIKGKEDISKRF